MKIGQMIFGIFWEIAFGRMTFYRKSFYRKTSRKKYFWQTGNLAELYSPEWHLAEWHVAVWLSSEWYFTERHLAYRHFLERNFTKTFGRMSHWKVYKLWHSAEWHAVKQHMAEWQQNSVTFSWTANETINQNAADFRSAKCHSDQCCCTIFKARKVSIFQLGEFKKLLVNLFDLKNTINELIPS